MTGEDSSETDEGNLETRVEVAGSFDEVMEKFNQNGARSEAIAEYPEVNESAKDIAAVLRVVERENGDIRSKIVEKSERDLSDVHMKPLLQYMRSVGLLELDGNTNKLGPRLKS